MPIHPLILVSLVSTALIASFVLLLRGARQTREVEWHELVLRLRPADRPSLAQIASRHQQPPTAQEPIPAQTMFDMLGGASGLKAIYRNSKVMLALAGYATRWNLEEGTVVTELIRRDAIRLQRTIRIIQFEMMLRKRLLVPLQSHRATTRIESAAALYHQMTQSLLGLYQKSHSGLYPQLSVVLRIC